MTRISICEGENLCDLEYRVNAEIERLEADGFGIKSMVDMSSGYGYVLAIVYGKGEIKTTRWSGAHT